MKHRYRITPKGSGPEPTDAEILRYRDKGRLLYNYQRARDLLHRRPIYRDPKAFFALLLIVLLAWLLSEGLLEGPRPDRGGRPVPEQPPPMPRQ